MSQSHITSIYCVHFNKMALFASAPKTEHLKPITRLILIPPPDPSCKSSCPFSGKHANLNLASKLDLLPAAYSGPLICHFRSCSPYYSLVSHHFWILRGPHCWISNRKGSCQKGRHARKDPSSCKHHKDLDGSGASQDYVLGFFRPTICYERGGGENICS